jgi:hypothetical protein
MWDLETIVRINQKAAENAAKGLPFRRDAVGLATGSAESQPKVEGQPKAEGQIIKLAHPTRRVACECCVG